ncbi:hypothetical protein HanRHA438_Chr09g0416941 [Helianthus annuus]|uniref:Uncharacterized protein n=1 Tax=Helianthus annuus TaxID=4232 RepID=A0A251TYY5_HELAN|nr:hypothetical protein HanRHA438_Chr09g0416941 [Helianthus annuus]
MNIHVVFGFICMTRFSGSSRVRVHLYFLGSTHEHDPFSSLYVSLLKENLYYKINSVSTNAYQHQP